MGPSAKPDGAALDLRRPPGGRMEHDALGGAPRTAPAPGGLEPGALLRLASPLEPDRPPRRPPRTHGTPNIRRAEPFRRSPLARKHRRAALANTIRHSGSVVALEHGPNLHHETVATPRAAVATDRPSRRHVDRGRSPATIQVRAITALASTSQVAAVRAGPLAADACARLKARRARARAGPRTGSSLPRAPRGPRRRPLPARAHVRCPLRPPRAHPRGRPRAP